LTATLAIAFLALSIVVLLVSTGLQVFSNIQAQQEAIASRQQFIAQDATRTVSSFIQEKFGVLDTTIRLAHPATASPDEQQQALESVLGLQPAFRQLAFLNAQGRELATASRLSQSASGHLAERLAGDDFARIAQGERYISSIYIDPLTSEPLVIMGVPATNVFGDFQGTLLVEVNLKFMWDLVDQLKVGETGYAYVIDRQGNLLAFSDTARVLRGENVGHVEEVAEFVESEEGADPTPFGVGAGIQGTTVVITYVPLGTPDWAVVTELPWDEAYQDTLRVALTSIAITLVIAILAGLLGVYLARRLAVPLVNLTQTATRITGGEMGLQAAVGGPREVASLASAFNSMTAQLRELIGSLEQRVAERTRDLALAADVGRNVSQMRNLDTLLANAVELIRSRFGLYYVQVYLSDPNERALTLRAGTGDVGLELMRRAHRLTIGPGSINGRAAADRRTVIVADTRQSGTFKPNPLLPNTRSEMAVPLLVGDRVAGVLDLQSDQPATLTEEQLPAFETLARQLAVAIDNAQLFADAELARAEVEHQAGRLTRQGWQTFLDAVNRSERLGYVFDRQTLTPLTEPLSANPAASTLDVPVVVAGEPIGRIQLERDAEGGEAWSEDDAELAAAVAARVANQIENLRLLAQAEQYRAEAEAVAHRLTREGWEGYLRSRTSGTGYVYDQHQVKPMADEADAEWVPSTKYLLQVQDEAIGEMTLEGIEQIDPQTAQMISVIIQQLGAHLENLRLSEQIQARAQREQILSEITARVHNAVDADAIMRTAVQEIGRALQRQAFIYLGDSDRARPATPDGVPVGGAAPNGDRSDEQE
jgi:GAF domain-containing protein